MTIDKTAGEVTVFTISQATAATFADLYIDQTFLCFVRSGTKRVLCPINGELIAGEGDLLVFPSGSFVTLENRPLRDAAYRAEGVCFAHDLIASVFTGPAHLERGAASAERMTGIRVIPAELRSSERMLAQIRETIACADIPAPIRRHRFLEPLIWLRHLGVELDPLQDNRPVSRVRRLLETDLTHPWRISEVARYFGMSEATMRRWLAESGHAFSKILQNARLERGLVLLQTTDVPISRIALECGFSTPSHFSDSFRKRFSIAPKCIRSTAE
ncbi:helix-turn-helix transcriptional regulator [Nitratireductor indicus]|uniref:helix-turn-helix transcriptional regulator n=1 Tax=Nitratireductor indicus TaxID=721133 RepID=UPI0028767976|nr:AraC family transcriptional regulator [Nitratireductor indicus]MDS1136745.1 AraC family transcriptional regulator [Nitratireductor indicus]